MRSRRALAGALAFGAALLAIPMTVASPVAAIGPVPGCDLGDIMTVPRDYDSWSVTLVDRLLRVEEDYVPPDLVPVTDAGIAGGGYVRRVAIDDLRAMSAAAASDGTPIGVWSPYRSYEEQVQIFNGYANQFGFEDAILYSQRPGHSEHQLGLGIDFMTAGGGSPLPGDWGATPAGRWMATNAWEFGWVLSYPLGEGGSYDWNDAACFHYEPWHYRYLGREIAAKVHESGLTIREYLWTHFTMVDPTNGLPIPTATPIPTPIPTPSPRVTPTASPSATSSHTSMPPSPAGGTPSPAGGWLGLDPPVVAVVFVLIGLLILTPIALAARHGLIRR